MNECLAVAEHVHCEAFGEERFANAGRAKHHEGADRSGRVFQVGAAAAQRLAKCLHRLALSDDELGEDGFHREQFLDFTLLHALQRDAGPLGDDVHDVLLVHLHAGVLAALFPLLEHGVEFLLGLLFLVAHGGGRLELLFLDGGLLLDAGFLDVGLEFLDLGWPGHGLDAGTGSGLVHDVDGLVRQETAGDVAVGKFDGRSDGVVGEVHLVMILVTGAKALENLDCILDGGRLDLDGLEASLEGGVLLDVLAILVEGGGADALHLASAQCRLDDVGGVHCALGGSGTNDSVQLVDEKDDVLGSANLVHHGLDAFLELAAVLGAGYHQREVEGDDAFFAQNLGDVPLGNLLCQALDDGGLAHAGLAQQHRVVFRSAAENLNDPLDFLGAADDRIHLALLGDLSEVAAERLERRGLDLFFAAFGFLLHPGGHLVVAFKIRIQLVQDFLSALVDVDVEIPQNTSGHAFALAQQAKQDVLGAHVGVVQRLGFLFGKLEDFFHPWGVGDVAGQFLVRACADLFLDLQPDGLEIEPHLLQDIYGNPLAKVYQAKQQMLGPHETVVEPIRLLPRQRQHLLGARGEIVH